MIYFAIICVLLVGILAWREWENQRERRALLDRILGYKGIPSFKQPKHEVKRQPDDGKAVGI